MSDWDTAPITLRKRIPKASAMKSEQVMSGLFSARDLYRPSWCWPFLAWIRAIDRTYQSYYDVRV